MRRRPTPKTQHVPSCCVNFFFSPFPSQGLCLPTTRQGGGWKVQFFSSALQVPCFLNKQFYLFLFSTTDINLSHWQKGIIGALFFREKHFFCSIFPKNLSLNWDKWLWSYVSVFVQLYFCSWNSVDICGIGKVGCHNISSISTRNMEKSLYSIQI